MQWIYAILLIHSSTHYLTGCLHGLTSVNSTVINLFVKIFLLERVFIFLECMLKLVLEQLGQQFTLWRNCQIAFYSVNYFNSLQQPMNVQFIWILLGMCDYWVLFVAILMLIYNSLMAYYITHLYMFLLATKIFFTAILTNKLLFLIELSFTTEL